MSKIKPELSQRNPYWIEKHRFYELKHFCLQYQIWKKAYMSLDGMSKRPTDMLILSQTSDCSDPTATCAMAKAFYSERISMIENTAMETDSVLGKYILIGVTTGCSYDVLVIRDHIPCGREMYYELYRRFFWLLNKVRK